MNRRRFFTAAVAAGGLGIAGCLGGDDSDDGDDPDDANGDGPDDGGGPDDTNGDDPDDTNGDDPGDANGDDPDDGDDGVTRLRADFEMTPSEIALGDEVTFDASPSVGDIVEYQWDFTGDGEFEAVTDEPVISREMYRTGTFTIRLRVVDGDGNASERGGTLTVDVDDEDDVTVIFSWEPELPTVGEEVTFEIAQSMGDIAEYRWDLTDDGEFDVVTDEPESVTHSFEESGFHDVTLVVEAASGAIERNSRVVEVQS